MAGKGWHHTPGWGHCAGHMELAAKETPLSGGGVTPSSEILGPSH